MKILVTMDSFKGSLSSIEAGLAVSEGIISANPQADVEVLPLADGGEGTVKALVSGLGGKRISVEVTGPIGTPVKAEYGMIIEQNLAILEMSSAAGLTLVPEQRKNPLLTTTFGVGEMIRDAFKRGCREFIIGLGGSATNDGGMGMMQALGVCFYDHAGNRITDYGNGANLLRVAGIDMSGLIAGLDTCIFHIACDVENPLYGENGAAYIYAPQKGADEIMVQELDSGLRNYADAVKRSLKQSEYDYVMAPGAGAAGGLGYAFLTFLQGSLEQGVLSIMKFLNIEEKIKNVDYVITGEGKTDVQTTMGKAPMGIVNVAKKYGKKVIILSGSVEDDAKICNHKGADAVFSIIQTPMKLKEAMRPKVAKDNLSYTAFQVSRLLMSINDE